MRTRTPDRGLRSGANRAGSLPANPDRHCAYDLINQQYTRCILLLYQATTFKMSFMKTTFKACWPVMALLLLSACKKDNDKAWQPPETNQQVFAVNESGSLAALAGGSGAREWTTASLGGPSLNSVAVNPERVIYADAASGKLYAMNTLTGTLIWEKQDLLFSPLLSPLIANEEVYLTHLDTMLVYGLANGELRRQFPLAYPFPHSLNYVNGNLVYGTCDGHLAAVDRLGNKIWEYLSGDGCYHGNPAIWEGTLYTLSSTGKISALSLATGHEIWSRTEPGTGNSSLVCYNGLLFAPDDMTHDRLYAFDTQSGELRHTYLMPEFQSCNFLQAPVARGDFVYLLTDEGTLVCYSIIGEYIYWEKSFPVEGVIRSSRIGQHGRTEYHGDMTPLVLANNQLFFGSGTKVYATDLSGNTLWSADMGGFVYSPPVVLGSHGNEYRALTAGSVYE